MPFSIRPLVPGDVASVESLRELVPVPYSILRQRR
jgi:hypothetical protein